MRGTIKYYLLGAIVLSLGILGYFVINRWEASRTFVTSIFKTETVVQPSPSPEPLPSLSFPTEIGPKWVGSTGKSPGGRCIPAEIRGESLSQSSFNSDSWTKVMNHFHAGKNVLLTWLEANRKKYSPRTYEVMKERVSVLKIQRPPIVEDPDLSWRGIGVFALDSKKGEMIRIGSGFLVLAEEDSKRSKFELTRLIAQVWAPCELQRLGVTENVWLSLLQCLKMNEEQICAEGSFSEAGWAVSTLLATVLSPPGCRMPILEKEELGSCLRQIGGKS